MGVECCTILCRPLTARTEYRTRNCLAIRNNNNNNHDNVYGAVFMTKVIARVHLVHLINVD